jgi:hypothetical protein
MAWGRYSPTLGVSAMPAGSVVQTKRYEWTTQTTASGTTWITATDSSYTFTPLYSTSLLYFFADVSTHAAAAAASGLSIRLLWRGTVITTQSAAAGHEIYTYITDTYQRPSKNAVATAGSGAGVVSLQMMAYVNTSTAHINQASQWASGYTILEVKQ